MNCAQMSAKTIMSARATAHSFTGDTGAGGSAGAGVSAGAGGRSVGGSEGRSVGGSEGINAGLRAFARLSRFAE